MEEVPHASSRLHDLERYLEHTQANLHRELTCQLWQVNAEHSVEVAE